MDFFPEEQSPLFLSITSALQEQKLSKRTEQKYLFWMTKFVYFHRGQHPKNMQEKQVQEFLNDLQVRLEVSNCTQKIALNAVLFMFAEVLKKPLSINPIRNTVSDAHHNNAAA